MKTSIAILGLGLVLSLGGCQSQSAAPKDTAVTAAVKTQLQSDMRLGSLTNLDVTTTGGSVSWLCPNAGAASKNSKTKPRTFMKLSFSRERGMFWRSGQVSWLEHRT